MGVQQIPASVCNMCRAWILKFMCHYIVLAQYTSYMPMQYIGMMFCKTLVKYFFSIIYKTNVKTTQK